MYFSTTIGNIDWTALIGDLLLYKPETHLSPINKYHLEVRSFENNLRHKI